MPSKEIFVSYSSTDTDFTEALVAEIEERGISCWYAKRDIKPGGVYPVEITRALDDCRALLLIFSADTNRAANENLHILREIDYAASRRKPILPVRIAEVEPHEGLAYFLRTVQWIEKTTWDRRLADRIAEVFRSTAVEAMSATTGGDPRAVVEPQRRSSRRFVVPTVASLAVALLGAAGFVERDRLASTWEALRAGPSYDATAPTKPRSVELPRRTDAPSNETAGSASHPGVAPPTATSPAGAGPLPPITEPAPSPPAAKPVSEDPKVVSGPPAGSTSKPTQPIDLASPAAPPPPEAVLERARAAVAAQDFTAAVTLVTPLAEAGHPIARFRLADYLENGLGVDKDRERAMRLYRQAADAGVACAMNRLGEFHDGGDFGGGRNPTEAIRWWQMGARGGCPWSKLRLGVAFKDGQGAPRDGSEAVRWLDAAARDGLVDAMSYLAAIYRRGELVPADPALMVRYLARAAALGHENAQYRLAVAYSSGTSVPKNLDEAYVWSAVAATKGEPEPIRFRNSLARGIDPARLVQLNSTAKERASRIMRDEADNYGHLDDWLWKRGP